MTGRLADIEARIQGIHQLGAVVNAIRGIAAARAQAARSQLLAVDSYAATIAAAVGRVLALAPGARPEGGRRAAPPALVLFCAEQGFAGAFSERVLDAAAADLPARDLFLIGTRGSSVAAERGVTAGWSAAMPAHSAGIPRLADQIANALYARVAESGIDRLDVVHSHWRPGRGIEVLRRCLLPLDATAFPVSADPGRTLLNLRPEPLLGDLTADYVHAQLCNAALHAFAAENEARMLAMAAAHSQIERQLAALQSEQRLVRQEEITAELIELAGGETASRPKRARALVEPPRTHEKDPSCRPPLRRNPPVPPA